MSFGSFLELTVKGCSATKSNINMVKHSLMHVWVCEHERKGLMMNESVFCITVSLWIKFEVRKLPQLWRQLTSFHSIQLSNSSPFLSSLQKQCSNHQANIDAAFLALEINDAAFILYCWITSRATAASPRLSFPIPYHLEEHADAI